MKCKKNSLLMHLLIPLLLMLAANPASAGGDASEYNMDSWKTLIADECRAFFDGCNQCRREPGKPAACTRMACAEYQKPYCRDPQSSTGVTLQATARVLEYRCRQGSFSIHSHRFVQDDQITQLSDTQIILRDSQAQSLYLLERVPSASGEKYANVDGLQFFSKGSGALVQQGDEMLYSDCSIES